MRLRIIVCNVLRNLAVDVDQDQHIVIAVLGEGEGRKQPSAKASKKEFVGFVHGILV